MALLAWLRIGKGGLLHAKDRAQRLDAQSWTALEESQQQWGEGRTALGWWV